MSTLSDRIRAKREQWLDISEGKRVKVRRPGELELAMLRGGTVEIEHVATVVVDWEGWCEADFLGGAIGKSDPLPFDPDAWREYVIDHAEVATKVAQFFAEMIRNFVTERSDAAKN